MRILQVVHKFPPESVTGTELSTYYLSKGLIHRGHDLSVFTSLDNTKAPRYEVFREEYDGLKIIKLGNWFESETEMFRTFVDLHVEESFRKYLEEFQPDIVHIQHLVGLSSSIIQAIFERCIPMVLTTHDYWYVCPRVQLLNRDGQVCAGPDGGYKCAWCVLGPSQGSQKDKDTSIQDTSRTSSRGFSIKRMIPTGLKHRLKTTFMPEIDEIPVLRAEIGLLRRQVDSLYDSTAHFIKRYDIMASMLSKVDFIITPSNYVKAKYVGFGVPEHKIRAVYHGLDTKSFGKSEKTVSDVVRFAYFGGLQKHKGIEVLLNAFANIPGSKASLMIFGPGADFEYERELLRLASPARAIFRGLYRNENMAEILSEVDVAIVPSLWEETFGLVVREAFLTNTPVIASRIGALEEAVEDGVDGYLVETGSEDSLQQKLQLIISDPQNLPRLKKGIKPVKDISQQTSEIESIYEKVLENHRGSA